MNCAISALPVYLCILALKVVVGDECVSSQFTDSGQCCSLCPVGSGVASGCGQEDTKCQPCQEGVTFSVAEGLSGCQACARCPPGVPQLQRCSVARDTQCDCGDGFFLLRQGNGTDSWCTACTLCSPGEGVVQACSLAGNTVCRRCAAGTYSEEKSAHQPCQPCSRCTEGKVQIRSCQADSDTLCMDKDLHILSRPAGSEGPWEFPRRTGLVEEENEKSSVLPGYETPRHTPPDQGSNHTLIYVSLLAAVVLGLLLYVAYKCWKSFQQKRALRKARAGELSTAAEGEKLHSDSGVFLDSHSLQESQPSKGSKRDSKQDTRLYVNLPPHRQEEVERLLVEGGGSGWRQLAAALGYEQERTDVFGRGQDPVRTLLMDWAQQEGSTLGLLCSALARIDRHDVASTLTAPTQGVSLV